MDKIVYQIQFYSEWQCGSGMTSAADLDSAAIKDINDFPYIPGRTLKGLLREAAEILTEMQGSPDWAAFIQKCFGNQSNKTSDQSEEGYCHFSDAELSDNVRSTILKGKQQELLFRKISSTAIEENGQAKEHSLRKFEMAVPLTLFAQITDCPSEYKEHFKQCLQFVKRLGSKRNRGWGRCDLRILEKEAK